MPLYREIGTSVLPTLRRRLPEIRGTPIALDADRAERAISSSALATVGRALDMVSGAGIPAERIILLGFSQELCLASEFVARNARRYGGLIVFSGGVIGPDGTSRDYPGSLGGIPLVFLGCSDIDPHVPIGRVEESAAVFERLGGEVDMRIYPAWGISSTGMSWKLPGRSCDWWQTQCRQTTATVLDCRRRTMAFAVGNGLRRHTLDAVSSILSSMAECAQCWCPGASHWKPA